MGDRRRMAELVIVPGTDHFFWHREAETATEVSGFAERVLG